MLCRRRRPEEDWIEFIVRTTAEAGTGMRDLGYADWVVQSRKRKWRFAGKAARSVDGRWTSRLLDWQPFFRCTPKRAVGRPRCRWADSIVAVAGGDWVGAAGNEQLWNELEPAFVDRETM